MSRLRSTLEDARGAKCEEVKKHKSTEGPVLVLGREDAKGLIVKPIETSYIMDILVRQKPRRLWEYLDKGVTRWE
ncbi:MAG: hypothetical protein ACFFER_04770 [Candidatus Thorarchaeota archaeon]